MLVLPSVAAVFGPPALLRVVGALGLAWLGLWLAIGREVPHRCGSGACSGFARS
jgi:ACS family sodium-dependent inorganic phosphate cotransporter